MASSTSQVTSASTGQPRSRQSGKSSAMPREFMTAPESVWSPISAPFSRTRIVLSASPRSFRRRWRWIAHARFAGPAPTRTTSTGSSSRSTSLAFRENWMGAGIAGGRDSVRNAADSSMAARERRLAPRGIGNRGDPESVLSVMHDPVHTLPEEDQGRPFGCGPLDRRIKFGLHMDVHDVGLQSLEIIRFEDHTWGARLSIPNQGRVGGRALLQGVIRIGEPTDQVVAGLTAVEPLDEPDLRSSLTELQISHHPSV